LEKGIKPQKEGNVPYNNNSKTTIFILKCIHLSRIL
jgi:hypothetical protein